MLDMKMDDMWRARSGMVHLTATIKIYLELNNNGWQTSVHLTTASSTDCCVVELEQSMPTDQYIATSLPPVREYCECGHSEGIANAVSQRVLRMRSVREYCE
jgi:hypothetical protein